MAERQDRRRTLPAVDRVLSSPAAGAVLSRFRRDYVADTVRAVLDDARREMVADPEAPTPSADEVLTAAVSRMVAAARSPLRPVVNATGVVLHTNLGRALLADEAVAEIARAAAHAVNLEYDLAGGGRGDRDALVEEDLCALTGAEAATAVNNNAAAVLLALNTLAANREVVVSRGELVEIGGSFRIPEVMAKGFARLREVGTTNRTHPHDYADAIGPNTALLLKVHTSNYRILGFTGEVALPDLVALGRARGIPVMEDLGSGALVDFSAFGLPKEPVVAERIAMGADLVTFSGDKLLGGPQAGLIVGRRALVERLRRNPLKRALRCDKLTLAALAATLRLYRSAPDLHTALPTLRWLTRPLADMEAVGRAVLARLQAALGPEFVVELVDTEGEIGSGALPTERLPSKAVSLTHPRLGANAVERIFRAADPPILGRIHESRFLLDLRGIFDPADLVPGGRSPAAS